ncbi:hypothetical protein HC341_06315 [Aquisalimonas sp. 2447]|uniref:hypothetical protein n=1 Tax=Aquisalimonas sp. 2447 TaxID=2740807 RepID=UPI00143266D2|nr:hypothetical protein [Aquisalimonas sp. 2447]QIT54863.1 hypothetical protein HC341_06315 [Aquisalimonas sp. 2447]
MKQAGPKLPRALPLGPTVVLIADMHWDAGDDTMGLFIAFQRTDGDSAGSLFFSVDGRRIGFDADHPASTDGLERLRAHLLRDCRVNADVAQDALDELLATLRDILGDVPVPPDLSDRLDE